MRAPSREPFSSCAPNAMIARLSPRRLTRAAERRHHHREHRCPHNRLSSWRRPPRSLPTRPHGPAARLGSAGSLQRKTQIPIDSTGSSGRFSPAGPSGPWLMPVIAPARRTRPRLLPRRQVRRRAAGPPSRSGVADAVASGATDAVFGRSNAGDTSEIWEPNWEPTVTVSRRRQTTTSSHRCS
jgi:hypothetical protein